jgi:translation elongation factor P/translation initiation factor 5A
MPRIEHLQRYATREEKKDAKHQCEESRVKIYNHDYLLLKDTEYSIVNARTETHINIPMIEKNETLPHLTGQFYRK